MTLSQPPTVRIRWGVEVRGLEYYQLGDGDLIVNVTDVEDITEVKNELGQDWEWTSSQMTIQAGEEEDEGATEWMKLCGVSRKVIRAVA